VIRFLRRILGMEALERELETLRSSTPAPIPGATQGGSVRIAVGGREVNVLPLPPRLWVSASAELPAFLLTYAASSTGRSPAAESLELIVSTVTGWLRVCGRHLDGTPLTDEDFERMSVPEAGVAMTEIARINGLDENLRAFFQGRLQRPTN
jgi:hypothetical protein